MRRRFETVLLWLVVVALPLQGAASANMLFCGATHHSPGSISVPHDHHAQLAKHESSDSAAGHSNHSAHHSGGEHGPSNCAGCAPCHLGTSTAASSPVSIAFSVQDTHPVSLGAISFPRYTTDGPDRPP